MAIPNLIDPRMLSQVGVPPPLQDSIAPVALPTPAPAPPMAPVPDMPTGLAPMPTRPQPPQPGFAQILVKAIPMLLAGIAAKRGGMPAAGGLLGGYAEALEKRRLLEEKQYEFDVQTAATEDARQARMQEQQANRQARIGNYITDLLGKIGSIDDPAQYAAVMQVADDTAQKAFGTPKGFITSQLGQTFDKTRAVTKAQKDARERLALVRTQLGDNYDDAVAANATITDPATGKRQSLRDLQALAGLDVTGAAGEPIATTPKAKSAFEQEQADVAAAVQQKQKELGRPMTPNEIVALRNQLRGDAAAAVRDEPSTQQVTFMDDGVPTVGNRNPKTGAITAALSPDGKKIRAVPSQSIINMNAARQFADEEITADRPDPVTANKMDPATGLTPNTLYQGGMAWALTNMMPSLGQSNSGQMGRARQAIINKGSAIAAQSGTDLPLLRAEYKAKAPALANLTTFYVRTAAAAGAAEDALKLAEAQSALVPRTKTPIQNTFTQWLATGDKALSSDPELAALQLYIYTAGREYAKVTGGGAGSVAALTDYAAQQVDKLISAAQSPETFAKVAQGMRNDMKVTTDNQNKQIAAVSADIANFLGNATGLGAPSATTTPAPGTGGTGRQTGAGPAGGPPKPSKISINGKVVTGPSGVARPYPTVEQAQAAYAAMKAAGLDK
jgi:hypothetical protein